MTKVPPNVVMAPDWPSPTEIEVTPEMLDAGANCFYSIGSWPETGGEEFRAGLRAAFCAMLRVRGKAQSEHS